MAGALGIRLAGPRIYASVPVDDSWIGDGGQPAVAGDIERALSLYRRACVIQLCALLVISALAWRL